MRWNPSDNSTSSISDDPQSLDIWDIGLAIFGDTRIVGGDDWLMLRTGLVGELVEDLVTPLFRRQENIGFSAVHFLLDSVPSTRLLTLTLSSSCCPCICASPYLPCLGPESAQAWCAIFTHFLNKHLSGIGCLTIKRNLFLPWIYFAFRQSYVEWINWREQLVLASRLGRTLVIHLSVHTTAPECISGSRLAGHWNLTHTTGIPARGSSCHRIFLKKT